MTDFQLTQWFRRGYYTRGYIFSLPDMPTDDKAIAAFKAGQSYYSRMPATTLFLSDEEILKILNT